ncbi:glycosyltransferase family 4 protein [Nitrospira moscoviensis]|uniref:Glycosyl transferase, group 1 n=1 Tax=Nitrospira moscoviensis TaxID=42253 RepID=A0A0K2GJG4_NITMO|nr:glycosyltransferase family 4 protein [Nitrospira moscoviensis]ALA60772.1 Glycosyl transferase, group 1 [Nitrospira moscoviensis]
MRITLVIATLGAGGAERVMARMADYWAEQGHGVALITLDGADKDFYGVHPAVARIGLGLAHPSAGVRQALTRNIGRIASLREAMRRSNPDVVISFVDKTNVLTLMATVGLSIPVVVSERIDPRYHGIERSWALLRRLFYRRAAALVVQTDGLRPWAQGLIDPNDVYVIPNPLSEKIRACDGSVRSARPKNTIVSMGRLAVQKGFDDLLRAFARCGNSRPDWSLVIIGEGPERGRLEALAAELGVRSRVTLAGRLADPFEVLQRADLFVLASRYEGFPNALLEAMACRLPVVSTDCPSGPRDIIRDGVDGVLVPPGNVTALSEVMGRLMDAPQERERLRARAVEVVERFGIEKIMKSWSELLRQVVDGRRPHWPVPNTVRSFRRI